MAQKDNKRGNREVRKPKQDKPKAASPSASPFIVTQGAQAKGGKRK